MVDGTEATMEATMVVGMVATIMVGDIVVGTEVR
eukprot:CAMPEP_0176448398 /NCGR_PEP_ID=MMETSP0127-20121128/25742_1 /TAXON_ID=938130 /ORGANISM="Platyophrya macrostoma, Strain WH" /LENGTH=33 /DNA_ID= /DNA_START= /DNA_END= /DNA_ORIENTATION=